MAEIISKKEAEERIAELQDKVERMRDSDRICFACFATYPKDDRSWDCWCDYESNLSLD